MKNKKIPKLKEGERIVPLGDTLAEVSANMKEILKGVEDYTTVGVFLKREEVLHIIGLIDAVPS